MRSRVESGALEVLMQREVCLIAITTLTVLSVIAPPARAQSSSPNPAPAPVPSTSGEQDAARG